jgi:predicted enzyme related to lactoylglutathione lyase
MYATSTPGFYVVRANENGIPGSIGASRDGGPGHVAFYVEVDDLEQHVSYAEELGGRIVRPPYEVRSPDGKFAYADGGYCSLGPADTVTDDDVLRQRHCLNGEPDAAG